jgi:nucleotide-binding universal stress UspA family protein
MAHALDDRYPSTNCEANPKTNESRLAREQNAIAWSTIIAGVDRGPLIDISEINRLIRNTNRATTEAVLRRRLAPGVVGRLEVRGGRAGAVLARMARDSDASLIVVGGKRHGVLAKWVRGSTAHYLVRNADVPVLVAVGAPREIRRLLVVADPRDRETYTVEVAKRFAQLFDASLQILYQGEFLPEIRQVRDRGVTFLEQRTEETGGPAWANLAVPSARRAVREGLSLDSIVNEIRYCDVDLVVVGSHGKGWVGRKLLAGTVGGLLHDLPASILVVPPSASRRSLC